MSGAVVWALTPTSVARVQIKVQMAYSARNQVDKEPFRGRATSIASSFKRFKGNVSEPERSLNIYTENVEMRRLCNFPQDCFT